VAVIYCPSTGFVGTPIDEIITSDSDGAFGSPAARWNIRGAALPNRIFPAGTGFTVSVLTSILAGVPNASCDHHGVIALIYAAVGTRVIYSRAIIYVEYLTFR
jgi:hypothetical protein